jgi:hypothetical protein
MSLLFIGSAFAQVAVTTSLGTFVIPPQQAHPVLLPQFGFEYRFAVDSLAFEIDLDCGRVEVYRTGSGLWLTGSVNEGVDTVTGLPFAGFILTDVITGDTWLLQIVVHPDGSYTVRSASPASMVDILPPITEFTVSAADAAANLNAWTVTAGTDDPNEPCLPGAGERPLVILVPIAIGIGGSTLSIKACRNDVNSAFRDGVNNCIFTYQFDDPSCLCRALCQLCVVEKKDEDLNNCLLSFGTNGPDGDYLGPCTACGCP